MSQSVRGRSRFGRTGRDLDQSVVIWTNALCCTQVFVVTSPVRQYAAFAGLVTVIAGCCAAKCCILAFVIAGPMHRACTKAELGTCILVSLGLHSSCAHCSLHPSCVLAFWLHGACTLTTQGQHSNCMGPTLLPHACIPQWLH